MFPVSYSAIWLGAGFFSKVIYKGMSLYFYELLP